MGIISLSGGLSDRIYSRLQGMKLALCPVDILIFAETEGWWIMIASRNKGTFILLAVLALMMITITDLDARIIHVAVNGDDITGDGSEANPYGGVQRAISDTSPGDAIYVHEGEYLNEPSPGGYPMYGAPGQYVYLMGAPGESKPVFSGSATASFVSMTGGENPPHHFVLKDLIYRKAEPTVGSHCINIYGANQYSPNVHNVIVDGCEFYQQARYSEMIKMAGVDSFVIKNCIMNASNASVIGMAGVGCHDGEVYNCRVDSCLQSGIQFKGGSSEIVIRNNVVNMAYFTGINCGGDSDTEVFRPPLNEMEEPAYEARGIHVYSNLIIDVAAPIAFDTARNCKAYNNLIVVTDKTRSPSGLESTYGLLWVRHSGHYDCPSPSRDNLLANNIFYFREKEPYYPNVFWQLSVGDEGDYSDTHEFYNNLWYCFEDSTKSWASWNMDGQVDYPIVRNNVFSRDPMIQTDPDTGLPVAINSVILGGRGVPVSPPDGFEYRDFFGEEYSYPPPIGPFNLSYEPGAPPTSVNEKVITPLNVSGKKE